MPLEGGLGMEPSKSPERYASTLSGMGAYRATDSLLPLSAIAGRSCQPSPTAFRRRLVSLVISTSSPGFRMYRWSAMGFSVRVGVCGGPGPSLGSQILVRVGLELAAAVLGAERV